MSNLIKSGFIAFSQDNTLVIDANQNKIIKEIDTRLEEAARRENSAEEALAEELIRDAGLEKEDFEELSEANGGASFDMAAMSEKIQRKAAEMIKAAKDEAKEIVSQAHDEVQQLRSAAFDDAEKIKAEAHDEGYRTGYEEGMAEVEQIMRDNEEAFAEKLKEAKLQLKEQEEAFVVRTEKKMVDILCRLIPSVTGVVLEDQRDVLLYLINNAIRDLDNSKSFVIKVSGEDYEDLADREEEIYGALNPNIEMEIFEDAKLGPLQCQIETDNGIVDVSLDVQLENLIKALRLMIKE
ncbi:MAG: FliH/SctL family protein [Bacteroidales bacterium]|nr:FliH/SctL family protein [Clostridium sp.]MCM1202722.1 FliH/SctL family protein [Bacteroidales bacterium]